MPLTKLKILALILVLITGLSLAAPSHAAVTDLLKEKQDAISEGGNQEAWLNEGLTSYAVSGINAIVGKIPNDVLSGVAISYVPGGMLNLQTNMVASLYNPPASGIQYLADLKDNFLGKPAYAQNGLGFSGLQPILPIWRGFRNITYILSSVFFILIGLMIMLRVKVSPQAVVTVQNAIPQLVTTLILITFSYAIAGLFIDLMQFLQGLVIALLFEVQGKGLGASLFSGVNNYNFETLTTGGIHTFANLTFRAIPMAPVMLFSAIFGAIIGGILGTLFVPISGPLGTAAGAVAGIPLAMIIILLIILVLLVVWMFKFYFGCLKAYVYVIFKIIVSPLELAMGAFPNSKVNFSTWAWDLIANLAIFPISMIFLVVGNMIIDAARTGLWAPHIISNPSIPMLALSAASLGNVVAVGMGLAVVSLVSKLPDMIPQFVFMIKPSPWSKAIGESFSAKSPVLGFARQVSIEAGANELVRDYNQRQKPGQSQTWFTSLYRPIVQAGIATGLVGERHKFEERGDKKSS